MTDMTDIPADAAMSNSSSDARSRALSISSDRPSATSIYNLMSPPLSVTPQPAFIAASAASQIVTSNHGTHSEIWYEQVGIEPSDEISLISNGALRLANNFIDHLLFNILATAKSATLSILRSAVVDVLKPKLARDVINAADEELKEYLGGSGVENLVRAPPPETTRDWDLELVWKRTRLRCMVYSSLGDMEEEDEDYHMEQEQLNNEIGGAIIELVSPAVAIYLTSILECVGEQVIVLSGQAAFTRLKMRYEKELKDGTLLTGTVCDRIVVEELDMERVALDRTMGRLWRAWKKKLRSPAELNNPRPFSRTSVSGLGGSSQRGESTATELPTPVPSHELDTTENQLPRYNNTKDGALELFTAPDDVMDPSTLHLPKTNSREDNEQDELSRSKSWAVNSSFIRQGSIRHTPSLPCRKKPQCDSMQNQRPSGIRLDELDEESVEKSQSGAPHRVETEMKTPMQIGINTNGLVGKATPGAVAVEGIARHVMSAKSSGATVRTDVQETRLDRDKNDETDSEVYEGSEESKILTNSRASVGEGSSSATSESARRASIVLTRSNSVGSVRVIEVPGPQSRASSVESNPRSPVRSFGATRDAGISQTPPIVEENDSGAVSPDTATKASPGAISPVTEHGDDAPKLGPQKRSRTPPKFTALAPSRLILSASNLGSSLEERHDSLQRPGNSLRSPLLPTLPERSPSRPLYIPSPSSQRIVPDSPIFPRPIQSESTSPARFKQLRSSEENSATPADVARNFEELIQSNETLQYTLTPENMRDIDVSGPPKLFESDLTVRQSQSHRTGRSDGARTGNNSRSSSLKKSMDSIGRSTRLGSHSSDMINNSKYVGSEKGALGGTSKARMGPLPQARDARGTRASIQDFADFIRSTGPQGESSSITTRPPTANSHTALSTTGMSPMSKSSSIEGRRGPKLQARDAVIHSSKDSSELIDFIRRGPASLNANSPRIPRAIAPFRHTQDSDSITSAMGSKTVDAVVNVRTSLASTNITEASAPSSTNSQSALLSRSNGQQQSGNGLDDDDMVPRRTQRRVRDPYAIDYSDEEDDDLFDMIPKPSLKEEESLIEFLNNYPPPAEPESQPITLPKKKLSTPNLITRLKSSQAASLPNHARKGSCVSENRSLHSRTSHRSSHTPIVVPGVMDKCNASLTSLDSPRAPSFKRMPMKMFDPRDGSLSSPKSAEFPDLLRTPPTQPQIASIQSEDKVTSGFSRIFERRKKSAVY